ncbi:MAG: hypothetical protein HQL72_11570 [Magnetococcales bacterium]|nr:hypothetical protein [Magnetococcales bacterium]
MRSPRSGFTSSLFSLIWVLFLLGASLLAGLEIHKIQDITELPGLNYLPSFLLTPLTTQIENQIIITLAAVITGFSVLFILGYVWKGFVDAARLMIVTQWLRRARNRGRLEDPSNDLTQWHWSIYPLFSRLWREFAETLHRQPHPDTTPENRRILYRSTLPAEMIFNIQTLVDVPMRVEFFRHLPGILTGAGIVSTFAGILVGLTEFNPAVEAELVTQELKNLFVGVSTAFVASFFAIFSAILITVIEKFILQWRYSQIVTFQGFLDDCFRSGAEPEYLAQLVERGDSGVDRLESGLEKLAGTLEGSAHSSPGGALDTLIAQLQQTLTQDRDETVRALDSAIKTGFSAPLRVIAEAVELSLEEQSRRQEEIRNLEKRLAGFGERMDVALSELSRGMNNFSHGVAQLTQKQGESLELMSSTLAKSHAPDPQQPNRELALLQTIADQLKAMGEAQQKQHEIMATLQSSSQRQEGSLPANTHQEIARSIQEGVQASLTENSEGILTALNQATQEIQAANDPLFYQKIIQAIQHSDIRQEAALVKIIQRLESQTAADIRTSAQEITRSFEARLDHTMEQGSEGIIQAINQSAQAILSNQTREPSSQEILSALQASDMRQEGALAKILRDLENRTAEQIQASAQQITRSFENHIDSAIQGDSNAIKAAIDTATQTLLAAGGPHSLQEILSQIQESGNRLERTFSHIFQELESSTHRELQASTRQIVDSLDEKRDLSSQQPQPSPPPQLNQQTLDTFKEQINQLITTLTDRINRVGDRITIERVALEDSLGRLGSTLRSATQTQAEETKSHLDSLHSRSQEQLNNELGRLGSSIQGELGQLLSLVRESSGEMVSRLSSAAQLSTDKTQVSTHQYQEITQHLKAAFASSLEKLNQQQDRAKKEQEEMLIHQIHSSGDQLASRVQTAVREELTDSSRTMNASFQQAQDRQVKENSELADRLLTTLSEKMSSSISEIASGLSQLRHQVTAEKEGLHTTMQGWLNELATLNQTESREMAERIKGVIHQVDDRHNGIIDALNQLNKGMGDDLLEMKEKILTSGRESEQKLEKTLSELGHGMEATVQRTGKEQTAFIELLGERLETMRKKLRIK